MATTLPLPVRLVAGMLATGLDRLRRLPQDLPALSVTVAGQAARLSMRVQQEITELAGRGDEVLSGLTSRPSEHPDWATFDDEDGNGTAEPDRSDHGAADRTPAGPPDMPGYDELRATQVRARLRGLDAAAVSRLLEYEHAHAARAPVITLLSNRITTLRSDHQGGADA